MTTDAGKWLEISSFRHFSSCMVGLASVSSNVSANDCHICWQRAIFLPATFQAGDEESLSKQTGRAKMALHKDSTHDPYLKGVTPRRCLIVRLLTLQRASEETFSYYSQKTRLTKVADSNLPAGSAMPSIWQRDKTRIWIAEKAVENMQ